MKTKHNTVPPSLVKEGFYFEKGNSTGWLRQYVFYDRRIAKAVYADFTGIGACDISSLGRWASRRLTESEALAEFPDEVAKIKKQLEEANAADPPYLAALLAAHPGLTKEKALEMIKAFGG